MDKLYTTIVNTINENRMFYGCTGCVLAVSGGSDSMAMLDFFCSNRGLFPFGIVVAHVHHGLRSESDDEQRMVERYCADRGVTVESIRLGVKEHKPDGISVETYCRQKRYEFFEAVRIKYDYSHIATAHNEDDSIETLLMHIFRGSGSDGAKGIPAVRGRIVRPMINLSKTQIDEHCKTRGIPVAIDKSNFEPVYTRNIYRNRIIPAIRQINPSFSRSAYGFIEKTLQDSDYIERQAQAVYARAADEKAHALDLTCLRHEHEAILSRCVRRLFATVSDKSAGAACTKAVCAMIKGPRTCAQICMPGSIRAVREYDRLTLTSDIPAEPKAIRPQLGDNIYADAVISAEYTQTGADISLEDFRNAVIRPYRDADSICIRRSAGTKSLGKLFRDAKVPPIKRKYIPAVEADGRIIFVYGFGTDINYRPKGEGIKFTLKK